jgi:hypothetical protein
VCDNSSQKPGEVITTVFIHRLITNKFRVISVPNKIPDLTKEKAFPNGMCPTNVKKYGHQTGHEIY